MKNISALIYYVICFVASGCAPQSNYEILSVENKMINTNNVPKCVKDLVAYSNTDKLLKIEVTLDTDLLTELIKYAREVSKPINSVGVYYRLSYTTRMDGKLFSMLQTQVVSNCVVKGGNSYYFPIFWSGVPVNSDLIQNEEYKAALNRSPQKISYDIYVPIRDASQVYSKYMNPDDYYDIIKNTPGAVDILLSILSTESQQDIESDRGLKPFIKMKKQDFLKLLK